MMKNQDLLKNLLVVGTGGAFVISTFLATVVFDRVSPNSTLADQEIEMVLVTIRGMVSTANCH